MAYFRKRLNFEKNVISVIGSSDLFKEIVSGSKIIRLFKQKPGGSKPAVAKVNVWQKFYGRNFIRSCISPLRSVARRNAPAHSRRLFARATMLRTGRGNMK